MGILEDKTQLHKTVCSPGKGEAGKEFYSIAMGIRRASCTALRKHQEENCHEKTGMGLVRTDAQKQRNLLHTKDEQEAKDVPSGRQEQVTAPRQDRAAEPRPGLGAGCHRQDRGSQERGLDFNDSQVVRVCLPTQGAQVRPLVGELEFKSSHALWCSQNKQTKPFKKEAIWPRAVSHVCAVCFHRQW